MVWVTDFGADGGGGGGGGLPVAVDITAFSGGGQTDATQLAYGFSSINAGFASGDSVALPLATAGKICMIFAEGGMVPGAFLSIWPQFGSTDTINGVPANDFLLTADAAIASLQNVGIFICAADGAWFTNCILDD